MYDVWWPKRQLDLWAVKRISHSVQLGIIIACRCPLAVVYTDARRPIVILALPVNGLSYVLHLGDIGAQNSQSGCGCQLAVRNLICKIG